MKSIQLTRGFVAIVDDADFIRFSKYNWYASTTSDGHTYAKRTVQKGNGQRSSMYLHREIVGNESKKPTDHINGNTLDNRRQNLRVCSNNVNSWNQKKIAGIHFMKGKNHLKRKKRWSAKLQFHKKTYFIGYYSTQKEAIDAVAKKRLEIESTFRGEFHGLANKQKSLSHCIK